MQEEHQHRDPSSSSPTVNCLPTNASNTRHRATSSSSSMDGATDMDDKHAPAPSASPSPIQRSLSAVTYCCGACGYDLRLRSSDRNTAGGMLTVGGAKAAYGRRGVVAFDAIDDARFGHADEFRCVDLRARRLFVRRTRLLCRKCGASVGFGYDDRGDAQRPPRYDIKIRALQPLADDDDDGDEPAATPPSDA